MMNGPNRPNGDAPPPQRPMGPNGPNQPPSGPGSPMPFNGTLILWIIMGVILVGWLVFSVWNPGGSTNGENISYSYMLSQAKAGNVVSVKFNDTNQITGTFKQATTSDLDSKQTQKDFVTYVPNVGNENPTQTLISDGVQVQGSLVSNGSTGGFFGSLLIQLLPVLLIIGAFFWLTRRTAGAQQGLFSFGQSKARLYTGGKTRTTFADVAGAEEAKVDLEEIVDYLRSPDRYQRLGGKIPHGVLLIGPPGTGKTLLAKAVAGEADVPFFSMSGSEFVEMLVGVGASRVRDLFDKAKKSAPCIIFIDELDAVGRQRGAGLGGGNDEREQTLNQILVEMDGFDARQAIVVIAATNRPDVLDPALLRPGRFDRRVVVDRPDRPGREAILLVHTREIPLDKDVKLDIIARNTPGMVGADLANLCNEAALLAARRNLNKVSMACFEDALDRITIGAQRPLVMSQQERKVTAIHESGHAIVALMSTGGDIVHKVTIVPRGQSLGVTQFMPAEDRHSYSKNYLLTRIAYGLGGRVAEEVALGEVTTGAENDFQNVTGIAREMVTRWGMSDKVGTVFYGVEREVFLGREMSLGQQREYSETTAGMIDAEVHRIIQERYQYVEKILTENRPLLDKMAEVLLERETIDSNDIKALMKEIGVQSPATSASAR
jgi:cell division protease FtsH